MKKAYVFTACLLAVSGALAQIPKLDYGLDFAQNAKSVAADPSGNAYVAGYFSDPLTIGAETLNSNGGNDIYVAKFDPTGNPLWAKSFGSAVDDEVDDIDVDAAGNVYIVGAFSETVDFDPGFDVFNLTAVDQTDGYILKLNTDGDLAWAGSVGGSSSDVVSGVEVDASQNVFVIGSFVFEIDVDPTPGVNSLMEGSGGDSGEVFFLKLNPNGTLNWAQMTDGNDNVFPTAVTIDATGTPIFAGGFYGTVDIDPSTGVKNLTAPDFIASIFLIKLDDETGGLLWGNQFAGDEDLNHAYGLATDSQNRIYMTGTFGGAADFDPTSDELLLTSAGASDIFIARFASFGNVDWAYRLGSTGPDEALSVATDNSDNVYLTGGFYETVDFDPKTGTVNRTSDTDVDVFILKLDAAANYQWVATIGNEVYDEGYSIATDNSDHVYAVGFVAEETDMDASACELMLDPGPNNAYLLRFGTTLPDCLAILSQPDSVATCPGQIVTFTVVATGLNLTYQWINLDVEGLPDTDVTEGSVFSGTQTATLTVNTSSMTKGTSRGFVVKVTGDGNLPIISDPVDLEISADPKAKSASRCGPGTVTIKATGAPEGKYQWYTTASGASEITGETGSAYTTPPLITTTTYYVSRILVGCETGRTPVVATVSTDCEPAPEFVWAKAYAGNGWTGDIFVDHADGTVYSTGFFQGSSDFDPGSGTTILNSEGSDDTFIAVFNTNGSLRWAKSVGGPKQDDCNAIAVDAAGNVLIAGYFLETADFDPGPSVFPLTSAGSWDTFILKLDPDGNFLWAKRIGGTPTLGDISSVIQTDAAGNIYVGGSFTSTVDFDPDDIGVFNVTASGNTDGHILKLDPDGNFISVTVLKGPGFENIEDLRIDATGNIYASGFFYNNTDFDPGTGTAIQAGSNERNAFLWKLNSANQLQWYKVFSAPTTQQDAGSVSIDDEGNIILGGVFEGTVDFDPGPGTFELTAVDNDAFVVKVDDAGDFIWARSIPGPSTFGSAMAKGTDVYIYGGFEETIDFNPGAGVFEMSSSGITDNYIVKLNTDGDFLWAIQTGGASLNATTKVGFDDEGNIYASGYVYVSGDYDPGVDDYILNSVGSHSGFLLKLGAASPFIFISEQPVSQNACVGATVTFTTTAIATSNVLYQWKKFDDVAGFFKNVPDGGGYSGVQTSKLSVNTTGNFGEGTYRCDVSADGDVSDQSAEVILTIVTSLPAPPVTNGDSCGPGPVTLQASGSSNGNYRWFTAATGGAIAGEVNNTYVSPAISATTTYFVSIVSGTCESPRVPVVATVNPLPTAPAINNTTVCLNSAASLSVAVSDGETRWYAAATGGSPVHTSSSFTTPVLTGTTTYYVSYFENGCESSRTAVTVTVSNCANNQPPAIAETNSSTQIGGTVSIDLNPLLSDPDNNIDLSTLKIKVQPKSGAIATIDQNGQLEVDYSATSFVGDDELTIEVCDIAGSCFQQVVTIRVDGDMMVYNAVSPNGDGKNDVFYLAHVDAIADAKDNHVMIFNRWGDLVFDVEDYDNAANVFIGKSNGGKELPSGTYYYKIEFQNGRKSQSGYLSLKR